MSAFCISVGFICFLYYIILIIYAGITADFAWIWLAAGAVLICGGFLIRHGRQHPGFFPLWLRYTVVIVLAAGCILFFSICAKVIQGMGWSGSKNLDNVIVLGAQVKGSVPSRALNKRLAKALEYAQENENTTLILSGGQGPGEDITEAECMSQYLTSRGIPKERLILEEKSTNTKENLEFSNSLTGCTNTRTGIISNNFHVYRAIKLAEKQGYQHVEGIAADSDPIMQVHYVVREVFALVKEKIKGNI